DRLMSNYKPESPLSQLNRAAASDDFATPRAIDPELFAMIAESMRYSRESDGAFDITVGPLMRAWGFFRAEGRVPTARQLDDARRRIGYQHVKLNPSRHEISFDRR